MTTDKLSTDRLRELQAAITPGPWTWTSGSDDIWDRWLDAKSNVVLQWDLDLGFCFGEGEWSGPDASLIAAAPDLLAEVLRLRTALEEAADDLDAYYEREYAGDYPYSVKKLAEARATNPARLGLESKGDK